MQALKADKGIYPLSCTNDRLPCMQANKNLLSTSVASQVDAARTGIQALDNAQRHLKTMQDCYRVGARLAAQPALFCGLLSVSAVCLLYSKARLNRETGLQNAMWSINALPAG